MMDSAGNDSPDGSGHGRQGDVAKQFALVLQRIRRVISEQVEAIDKASAQADLGVGHSGARADQSTRGGLSGAQEALANHLERGLEQLQKEVRLLHSFRSRASERKAIADTVADVVANIESRITGLDLSLRILSERIDGQARALNAPIIRKRSVPLAAPIVLASLLAALVAGGVAFRFPTTLEMVQSGFSRSLQGIAAWRETAGSWTRSPRAGGSGASSHQPVASVSAEPGGAHEVPAASSMSATAPTPTTGSQNSEVPSARTDPPPVTFANLGVAESPSPDPAAGTSSSAAPTSAAPTSAGATAIGSPPALSPTSRDLAAAAQRSQPSSAGIDPTALTSAGAQHLIREVRRDAMPTAAPRNPPQVISGRSQTEVPTAGRSVIAGVPSEVSAKDNVSPPAVSSANSATPQDIANKPSEPTLLRPATTPDATSPPTSPALLNPMPAAGGSRIILRARAASWIEVRERNGRVLLNRLLRQNETWVVPDRPELLLTTGNAGATELLVDGAIAPRLGAINGVRRNFPLDPELLKRGKAPAQPVGRSAR